MKIFWLLVVTIFMVSCGSGRDVPVKRGELVIGDVFLDRYYVDDRFDSTSIAPQPSNDYELMVFLLVESVSQVLVGDKIYIGAYDSINDKWIHREVRYGNNMISFPKSVVSDDMMRVHVCACAAKEGKSPEFHVNVENSQFSLWLTKSPK